MVGITSYGSYVPLWRMGGKAMGMRTERAIACFDEDSLTMAVAAGENCLKGSDRASIEKVFFASTTFPYKEKQAATVIAAACDLPQGIGTVDIANSLKGGTSALLSAFDAVAAKSVKKALVVAADTRIGLPMEQHERIFGDGAAAFVIGDTDVAAEIEASYSVSCDILDIWRTQDDKFVRFWEARFGLTEGYNKIAPQAVAGLLKKTNLQPSDFTKIVFYTPDPKSSAKLAKKLGFDPATQLQNPMLDVLGNTGTSFALIQLAAALDEAKPGDRILVLGYGDGADAIALKVTDQIDKIRNKNGVKAHLESKKMIPAYTTYLIWRGLLNPEHEKIYYSNYQENTAVPALYRERSRIMRLCGSKCKPCGVVQFPPERVCVKCGSVDQYDEVKLSDKKATVYTYSMDFMSMVDQPCVLPVVDFEGGGRAEVYMTDKDVKEVKVGMEVEMTFRKIFFDEGIYHYYWKAMPVRFL
ncbi:MAG: OB-fold domain-containing protein [Proteobacteria bacterium]|nr:OB-fold domain-containing protein [Pseudomonadota bacterium]